MTWGTVSSPVSFARLNRLLSAIAYGADPTGAKDSLAALNAANAAARTGYVYIPPGTYDLSANTNQGLWKVAAGATFTGAGALTGKIIQESGLGSTYIMRLVSANETAAQLIGLNIEQGYYQTGAVAADQFGQTTECWTPSASTATWTGELTGTYGSFSHFGSGSMYGIYGGGFEGFNSGPATVTLVVGVSGTANNGGVAAGDPQQNPTNTGAATNLRAVTGAATNSSSGTVGSASIFFANAIANTGAGSITNGYGLLISDQTAALTNYAIYTGAGINHFGDVVTVVGNHSLPAATTNGQLWVASGFANPSIGRIYCGDGSGYRLEFAARTGSADTLVAYLTDAGTFVAKALLSNANPIGYTSGAGGAVVQATSKATAVTLNTATGTITTSNAALAAGATVSFNFTNSKIAANSVILFSIQTGSTAGAYVVVADNVQNGVCDVSIQNRSGGSLSEAIVINFVVLNGSAN